MLVNISTNVPSPDNSCTPTQNINRERGDSCNGVTYSAPMEAPAEGKEAAEDVDG